MNEPVPLVFLVDDDALVLAVTRRVLTRGGYEVATFDDPRHAVEELAKRTPVAVVADLNMPELSGCELLELVRDKAPHALRVLYTGEGHLDDLGLPAGVAHAVLSKTESMRTLPETLAKLRNR